MLGGLSSDTAKNAAEGVVDVESQRAASRPMANAKRETRHVVI